LLNSKFGVNELSKPLEKVDGDVTVELPFNNTEEEKRPATVLDETWLAIVISRLNACVLKRVTFIVFNEVVRTEVTGIADKEEVEERNTITGSSTTSYPTA